MANYYVCGWAQVLHAVAPAGAKDQAGTRAVTFLEAVPTRADGAADEPLSPKQAAALEHLRSASQPLTAKQLAQLAGCGTGPIDALVDKGLARRVVRRVESSASVDPSLGA